ncbi:glycosyl hydrolase family 28 protein [candidate division KSB1 bacterium]|nr:glycosyl hydrolase family 28 protein [candidate division KSB1 bacterium]
MKTVILFLIFGFYLHANEIRGAMFNILDQGAVGDAHTLNTRAIQKTIDQCHQQGGGTVVIPAGVFLTGTIQLRSNIHLFLESGSVLKGSTDVADYQLGTQRVGLLYTQNANNITISGPGNIDGNGDSFMYLDQRKKLGGVDYSVLRQGKQYMDPAEGLGDGPVEPKERPFQMIIFSNCKNVTVRDVLITNSPFWTVHFADCDGVLFTGIKLYTNLLIPNSDGLDLTSCSNVMVSDCDIRAGDDAIAITGYSHHFNLPGYQDLLHVSENITVTNCTLQSRSAGIRIGGLDQNSMKNYTFNNIIIHDSNRGIGLFARDAGAIENMIFSNIVIETRLHTGDWWGNAEPIHLSAVRLTEKVALGKIKNIKFQNIIARSESGILVYGTEENVIENVAFQNVTFQMKNSPLNAAYGGNFDLRPVLEIKQQLFSHDIPAFYAQYVKNLRIESFDLEWEAVTESFFTHGLEINHFQDLFIANYHGTPAPVNPLAYALKIEQGQGYSILNSTNPRQPARFLQKSRVTSAY